jgi:AcrR family transcriptional regulator
METREYKRRIPAAARRELIVEAALAEFAERGYEAASIGRIAAAAGITRSVLYDHFPSKHALFVDLLRTQHTDLIEFLRRQIASEAPMRERMRATWDAFFAFAEERPLAWRLLFPSHPPVDPAVVSEYRRSRAESNRLLAQSLAADALRTGVDPESGVGRAIFAIHIEALHGAARWWHAHPEVSREEIVGAVMAALWTGMGAVDRHEPWVAAG